MINGKIVKALSGFYYVQCEEGLIACRARGKFRLDGTSPLVGDDVCLELTDNGSGVIKQLLPRQNFFIRPAVANVDQLVLLAANVNPVTDPFLLDRVAVIAEHAHCGVIICINKCDRDPGNELYALYQQSGYPVLRTSALTGEGVSQLRELIRGNTVAFTGNSGVGKSSLLNALCPDFQLAVGEVSEKLGRGRHTTRHVELFDIGGDTFVMDTPGFASFDLQQMEPIRKDELQQLIPEFRPHLGKCRFDDCMHLKEPGCCVLEAVEQGRIPQSRHNSYVRLFEISAQFKEWEQK